MAGPNLIRWFAGGWPVNCSQREAWSKSESARTQAQKSYQIPYPTWASWKLKKESCGLLPLR